MVTLANGDDAWFGRPRHLPGVELVTVAYRDRSFPEHSHAEYVVGGVLTGAETLVVRGRPHVVTPGDVLLLHPDEPHANATLGSGASLPVSHISSTLRPASRYSRRLDGTRFR